MFDLRYYAWVFHHCSVVYGHGDVVGHAVYFCAGDGDHAVMGADMFAWQEDGG